MHLWELLGIIGIAFLILEMFTPSMFFLNFSLAAFITAVISVYTNKPDLQKQLCKSIGEPEKEFVKGKSILASRWIIPLNEKSKISKMMLKANIFQL